MLMAAFLQTLCVGGVVRNHDEDWITDFSHYEVERDALLAELHAIQMGLDFCK